MAYEYGLKQVISGDSKDECLEKLYKLYGDDYQILNKETKLVKYGLFKLRSKYQIFYTYTVDKKNPVSSQPTQKEMDEFEKNRQAILMNSQFNQVSAQVAQQIKSLEDKMTNQISKLAEATQEKHESIQKIEELLEQNEFSFSYIQEIEDKIRNEFSLEQLDNFDLVERRVIDWIGESIIIAPKRVFRPPHVVILVGPTGVGKTTTLVKLAAQVIRSFKNENRKAQICFISTDSMRVGAKEQLERWGEMMDYKVLKAESIDDLKILYEENRDRMDAIFIDTSGYSPNDAAHIGAMKALPDVQGMNPDVYLAMTASTKARDLSNIMKNYEPFGYNSVIITKCDETEQYGNVISMLHEKRKAISYITDGQKVVSNILKANVVDFLIRLDGFKVDRIHIEDKFGDK